MKIRPLTFLSLLLSLGFFSAGASAQTKPVVCLKIEPLAKIRLLPWEAPITRVVYFSNTEGVPITIAGIHVAGRDSAKLTLLPKTFPLVLQPYKGDSVSVIAQPYTDTAEMNWTTLWVGLQFEIDSRSGLGEVCSSPFENINVEGYPYRHRDVRFVEPSPQDVVEFIVTSFVVAPPDEIRGFGDFAKRIAVVNNTDAYLTYTDASIGGPDAEVFMLDHITAISGDRLMPGDSLFLFTSLQEYHPDTAFAMVTINWQNHSPTQIPLNGIRGIPKSVRYEAATHAELSILGNPATGKISFETKAIGRCRAELLDLLGRSLDAQTVTTSGRYDFSAPAAKGAYLLRLSGVDDDGNAIVLTRRVVAE